MATLIQKKKRQKQLLIVLGGIFVLTFVVLFVLPRAGGGPTPDLLQSPEGVQQAAQAIISEIAIPRDFFENKVLRENFFSYEPISAPLERGRSNPFAPLDLPGEAEEE